MNILFYDHSPVAILYGWALEKAGHTVDFWERTSVDHEGTPVTAITVLDARKNPRGAKVSESWSPKLEADPLNRQTYDLLIVPVRHDLLASALKEIETLIGKASVLVFGNVWDDPALSALPTEQVVWGYPSAGGTVDDQGVLAGALLATVHIGTAGTEPTSREQRVADLFSEAGFQVRVHRNFRGWLWLQFAVGAGLAAQTLQAGSAEALMASPVQLKKAILNIRELFPLVAARGIDLKDFSAETIPFRFPAWLGGLILQNSLRSQEPIRFIWEAGDDTERMKVCQDVLSEARRLGIPAPRLEALEPLFSDASSD